MVKNWSSLSLFVSVVVSFPRLIPNGHTGISRWLASHAPPQTGRRRLVITMGSSSSKIRKISSFFFPPWASLCSSSASIPLPPLPQPLYILYKRCANFFFGTLTYVPARLPYHGRFPLGLACQFKLALGNSLLLLALSHPFTHIPFPPPPPFYSHRSHFLSNVGHSTSTSTSAGHPHHHLCFLSAFPTSCTSSGASWASQRFP
jgi:hypothetical protein